MTKKFYIVPLRQLLHVVRFGSHGNQTNALRRWTPTLEINTDKKTGKSPRTTGWTYILYCHPRDLSPWPVAAYTEHNYGPHKWSPKSDTDDWEKTRIDREKERQRDGWTYKLDWTPLGSFRPQCGDNIRIYLYIHIHCPPHIFLCFYEYFHMQQNKRTITSHANDYQEATRTTWQRDKEIEIRKDRGTDGWTYNLDCTPLGDKWIATLEPNTGN